VSEFLRAYLTVAVFAGAAGLLMALSLGIGRVLRPNNPNKQKLTSYESGVDPVGAAIGQTQVRYYIFALLFVMFDVEAVFIFPWAIGLERYDVYGLGAMGLFVFLLTLPLLYAWRKGVLRWV
jgi:NADH-quinone oxidoreductase subunit A